MMGVYQLPSREGGPDLGVLIVAEIAFGGIGCYPVLDAQPPLGDSELLGQAG